ncbi:ABC transporter permease [Clostridium sp. 'deep sea']|uniref:ABC transporter permease n=1 Tax=Clostridium sp. 'deep sea' TaxID=2779445 RepID=UPI00189665A6|nr:ABC transporter permease [Clostridium sp. 'deep sea']QOR35027.1 ABC transporter permease [Clostridium sp. 'deep sea']
MLKNIWNVFLRDLKVNLRDFMALYIIVFPILAAIAVNIFAPGINDTTINIALVEGDNAAQVEYYKNFAKVELFKDVESMQRRVEKRDSIVGFMPAENGGYILTQGNEGAEVVEYAKVLKSFYDLGISLEDTNAEIRDFGRTVPPLKKVLVNVIMMFTAALGGMLIAFNIVEEKTDRTLKAVQVTTVSRMQFILGKSLMGILVPIIGSIAVLLITGFSNVNIGQAILLIASSSLLSMLIGFIEGIRNDDIMSAAAGVKLIFLPLAASVVAIELLASKWQKFFYWSPFYWAYKGNNAVLSYTASWQNILLYTGLIVAITGVVYLILSPKIRKGFE